MNGVLVVRVSPNCHLLHNLPILIYCRARHARMQAYVYKSQRKADTFVYLAQRDDFACLPEPLRTQMGALSFVLEVALTPDRKLARGDAAVIEMTERFAAEVERLAAPRGCGADTVDAVLELLAPGSAPAARACPGTDRSRRGSC